MMFAMSPTTANPKFQKSCSECSPTADNQSESCRLGKVGGSVPIKEEQVRRHIMDEIHSSTESFECHKWDMEVPVMNHEDRFTPKKRLDSESECTINSDDLSGSAAFELIDNNRRADWCTIDLESGDILESLESLESPRSDDEARHRAWLQLRQYRGRLGARNLHID